jgi:hypothetical protein
MQIPSIGEPQRSNRCHRHKDIERYADLAQVVAGRKSCVRDNSGIRRNVADGDSPNSDL